ncbi:MAG: Fmu and Fmv protein [Cyanobacteriota bacterium]|jgi:16S rRNA (cytosine967-C5)-methyltransferase
MTSARTVAFLTLREIDRRDSYADLAIDRSLQNHALSALERGLFTELVYGVIRRQRTLDCLIETLGDRPIEKQPPDLRRILQLGLYQLRYLDHIPASAAVHTSVDLAKAQGLKGLSGVVNGMLRRYQRSQGDGIDVLPTPPNSIQNLGQKYSFPDWIVDRFQQQWGWVETEALCQYFNQPPSLDLRINPLKASRDQVIQAFAEINLTATAIAGLPQGLRIAQKTGSIPQLPGFKEGWWTVQDASAQWVAQILDPQPGEIIFDVCAAPGGKTTHIAELMGDQGQIYAGDRTASRLQKVATIQQRLGLTAIKTWHGDVTQRDHPPISSVDRALLDVPCSGLGTLHRNPDLRWRQTTDGIDTTLIPLQRQLLTAIAPVVKSGGILVYSTCTLNPAENQHQIQHFLNAHPDWHIEPFPWVPPQLSPQIMTEAMLTILPHHHHQDGFFIAKLKKA